MEIFFHVFKCMPERVEIDGHISLQIILISKVTLCDDDKRANKEQALVFPKKNFLKQAASKRYRDVIRKTCTRFTG